MHGHIAVLRIISINKQYSNGACKQQPDDASCRTHIQLATGQSHLSVGRCADK